MIFYGLDFTKKAIKTGINILCFLCTLFATAQQDFNNFQTLVAQGTIPDDFTKTTNEKILEDRGTRTGDLSTTQERIFLEGIHQGIDQLLHSGSVIYGDEISMYVQAVAANLLKDEPELLAELRFYTMKSNETNALSTDQGIIFVTTGLISQLTSEAQLAYVLSHEIAHYTEKHVIETFDWKSQNKYQQDRIERLSVHTKEHEFEADKIALKRYHAAGYSDEEIISTFDVLMYSYLPFDEVELPMSYYSTEKMYIPEAFFATKKYPIKAEEDYNDARSSHPNIKKRKDAALEALSNYNDWGKVVNSQGESKFIYIRNLARFESLRTDIIDANFGQALYSIFLLEREFPQSVYLKRMKAQAWLGLTQFKAENMESNTMPSSSDYEGESAAMYFFLKKLNDNAAFTLAIRNVYDIQKELPEDELIAGVMERLVETIAANEQFTLSKYSKKNFHESAELAKPKVDTAKVIETPKTEDQKSKYEKIKTKKTIGNDSFDSTKFYFYGLSDVMLDSAFILKFNEIAKRSKAEKEGEIDLSKLSKKERYELEKATKKTGVNPLAMGMDKYILVQPGVVYNRRNGLDRAQSEKTLTVLYSVLEETSSELGITQTTIDQQSLTTDGTVAFNERNTLYSMLEQTAHYEGVEMYPVDHDALKEIEQHYGTSNILFTAVEHYYHAEISPVIVIGSMLLFPAFPLMVLGYLPVQLLTGHHTDVTVLVLNGSNGKMAKSSLVELNIKPSKHYLGAHFYNVLSSLQQTPH
ncbi:MAG: M48 family metallopeptidase [Fluviicola sp.]|nr:M48 family metallopeptidase [Fluviicola sp.]